MTDGQFLLPGRLDAPQLTADANNWAPTGIGTSTVVYVDADAARDITGINAEFVSGQGAKARRILVLVNDGATHSIGLVGSSGASDARNQFGWSGTYTYSLRPGESVWLIYDGTALKWRCAARSDLGGGGTPGGSTTQVQFNNAGAFGGDAALTWDATSDQLVSTNLQVTGVPSFSGDTTHAIGAGLQNNYTAGGNLATAGVLRLDPTAGDSIISGLVAPVAPHADGRVLFVVNVHATNKVTLLNGSGSSDPENTLSMGGNMALRPSEGCVLLYDTTASRWRVVASLPPVTHTHADSTAGGQFNASDVFNAGTMPTARLGSGTADATTFLRGDQTYARPSTFITLGSNQVNNHLTANTMQDVTGLSFSVTSGQSYWFRAVIGYTAPATTTGSRWSCNGPTASSLFYTTQFHSSATAIAAGGYATYDLPAAASLNSSVSNNRAVVEGTVTPSASGTLAIRFASEVSSSAITALAGSWLEWRRIA